MASDYSGSDCSPDATVAQEARPRVFISRCPLSIELKNAVQALAKSVRHDQEVSGQLILLAAKSMAESKNWSTVAISQESWAKLFMVRAQIMSEGAQLVSVVSRINPDAVYLSERAMVVQLSQGTTALKNFLAMEEDCGLVIPLSVPTTANVVAWEEGGSPDEKYGLPLSDSNAFVMTGRSSMRTMSVEPLVCVIFCLARGG